MGHGIKYRKFLPLNLKHIEEIQNLAAKNNKSIWNLPQVNGMDQGISGYSGIVTQRTYYTKVLQHRTGLDRTSNIF